MRTLTPVLVLLGLAAGSPLLAQSSPADAGRARNLAGEAERRLADGTVEQRRIAAERLERATLLDPTNADYPLRLGWLCLAADKLSEARRWAGVTLRRDPASAAAHHLDGAAWRRDWLVSADPAALDRAVLELARSLRLDPSRAPAWLALVPLLVERGEIEAARDAAAAALRAAPRDADAMLAAAYTSQRLGDTELATALFERAIPRLARSRQERFHDLGPLLLPGEAERYRDAPPAERARFEARFWNDADPDLVTALNEARTEFWARAAHATFLYDAPSLGTWDQRGDLYVRYGPPDFVSRNPVDIRNTEQSSWGSWMVWSYASLGMNVWMLATNPLGAYGGPKAGRTFGPFPFADSLARHPEWVVGRGGWTVMPKLPPGHELLPVEGMLARFDDDGVPRLFAHAETPGAPGAARFAEYAVRDAAGTEIARGERPMSASACDPVDLRAASFTASLPPGRYDVGLAVHDGAHRRGLHRGTIEIPASPGHPGLSDVVVTCATASAVALGQTTGPVEPDPRHRVGDADPLTLYFEIYGLTAGDAGTARFEYACTVSSLEQDRRGWVSRLLAPRAAPDAVEARREETVRSAVRRQFLSLPIEGLPPGRYRVEVRVKDLVGGGETRALTAFTRAR